MRATVVYALCSVCLASGTAGAQPYPAKPVRIIVASAAGGSNDFLGRLAASRLSEAWGAQVLVENRPGAGGNIGIEICAKAVPDGYTACTLTVSESIGPALNSRLPYRPLSDFVHVTLMAVVPNLLVVHPSTQLSSVRDLVGVAKRKPGTLTYASGGNGTSSHLVMEMLKARTGANLIHVPYRGQGQSLVDQVSGRIDAGFITAIGVLPYVRQRKLRAIAVSTAERFPPLPELPTVQDSGVKDFDASSWTGIAMPAGVPREVVVKMNGELVRALQSAELRDRLLSMGGIPGGNAPEEFTAFIKADIARWEDVVRTANIRMDR